MKNEFDANRAMIPRQENHRGLGFLPTSGGDCTMKKEYMCFNLKIYDYNGVLGVVAEPIKVKGEDLLTLQDMYDQKEGFLLTTGGEQDRFIEELPAGGSLVFTCAVGYNYMVVRV